MKPITGGCQCGAVRYEINLSHLVGYTCHCNECKKQTSSAFAISVPVPAANLRKTGETKTYARPTDSGTTTNCFSCPSCGTRLYHQSARSPEFATIKGGTLDDQSNVTIRAHLWTKRKAEWITPPKHDEIFLTQPDDLKGWRAKLLKSLKQL